MTSTDDRVGNMTAADDHGRPMTGITNKVVVIAGASSGIGEAMAVHLAARGARLILGARREPPLQGLADRIVAAGGQAIARACDVRRLEDMRALVAEARDSYGRLDVFITNAGSMAVSPLDDLRVDEWNDMVDVNLKGVLHGIAAALPVFRDQHDGHFIHTASTAAYRIVPQQAVYAATKTAVKVLTEGLRQEAGPNLRVTLVSPGFTNTEGIGRGGNPDTAAAMIEQRDRIAMPPSAVARAVAFAIEQPAEVDVGEIVVRPTAQA